MAIVPEFLHILVGCVSKRCLGKYAEVAPALSMSLPLPEELHTCIFSFAVASLKDLAKVRCVNKFFLRHSLDPAVHKKIDLIRMVPSLAEQDFSAEDYRKCILDRLAGLNRLAPGLRQISFAQRFLHKGPEMSACVTDSMIATAISLFSHLRLIVLTGCVHITHESLICIASSKTIVSVDLSFCNQLDDSAVEALQDNKSIGSLVLEGCTGISDTAIEALASRETRGLGLNISGCHQITEAGLVMLKDIPRLQVLNIAGHRLSGQCMHAMASSMKNLVSLDIAGCSMLGLSGIRSLAALPNLLRLRMSGPHVTDDFLKELRESPLELLDMTGCSSVTDASLEHVSKLSRLKALGLSSCGKISDAGLLALVSLIRLRFLSLTNCFLITDEGLRVLSCFKQLEVVSLYGCHQITDIGIWHLSNAWRPLRSICVGGCKSLTDVALDSLALMGGLEHLGLDGCNVSKLGLSQLRKCEQLRHLSIVGCKLLSEENVTALSENLPRVRILTARQGCDSVSNFSDRLMERLAFACFAKNSISTVSWDYLLAGRKGKVQGAKV